ncbi:MBL fold metallo-hydrolase [Paenibacillus sp. LMG 31461]|uniref:MBL fold metallo-hydrolase n=1 Tax=Paenibacillus plantarum TaxID=2654975 RepID=A0ABX1XBE4_9BACL|nr:MBL fold metallo-hydrolase [Paenibacillus plantarum]NOU65757.1 MBL fold metallo-hydrolase [Paenibacillus plantarum]
MKLTERVYVVGGGSLGYGLSSPYDCNVYAIDSEEGVLLIDAGSGLGEDAILNRLRDDGIMPERVNALVLTHAHSDHAGGARGLKDQLGLLVMASKRTAAIVESGDEAQLGLEQARRDGIYPEQYQFKSCPVDRILREGDIISRGAFRLRVLYVPGHSHDMIALFDDSSQTLFAADTVFSGGKLAIIDTEDFSMKDYRSTIAKLSSLKVERLFAGHGEALLERGGDAVRLAHERFEQEHPPLSIV